jgi:hypothetical protein
MGFTLRETSRKADEQQKRKPTKRSVPSRGTLGALSSSRHGADRQFLCLGGPISLLKVCSVGESESKYRGVPGRRSIG